MHQDSDDHASAAAAEHVGHGGGDVASMTGVGDLRRDGRDERAGDQSGEGATAVD
jgi:hypothetical protein